MITSLELDQYLKSNRLFIRDIMLSCFGLKLTDRHYGSYHLMVNDFVKDNCVIAFSLQAALTHYVELQKMKDLYGEPGQATIHKELEGCNWEFAGENFSKIENFLDGEEIELDDGIVFVMDGDDLKTCPIDLFDEYIESEGDKLDGIEEENFLKLNWNKEKQLDIISCATFAKMETVPIDPDLNLINADDLWDVFVEDAFDRELSAERLHTIYPIYKSISYD